MMHLLTMLLLSRLKMTAVCNPTMALMPKVVSVALQTLRQTNCRENKKRDWHEASLCYVEV